MFRAELLWKNWTRAVFLIFFFAWKKPNQKKKKNQTKQKALFQSSDSETIVSVEVISQISSPYCAVSAPQLMVINIVRKSH